jgi:hypothetical protein
MFTARFAQPRYARVQFQHVGFARVAGKFAIQRRDIGDDALAA